jgi:hypothetical protein
MRMFLERAGPEEHKEQVFYAIAGVFFTMLGTAFIIFSVPISRSTHAIGTSLFSACDDQGHGVTKGMYYELYATSQVLQAMRARPDCATKDSVEHCRGYLSTPASTILKQLETTLDCSGFCFNPEAANNTEKFLLLTTGSWHVGSIEQRRPEATAAKLAKDSMIEKEMATAEENDVVSSMLQLEVRSLATSSGVGSQPNGLAATYPPTLFSLANYQATCESSAARRLYAYRNDAGSLLYSEGYFLVIFATFAMLLKLFELGRSK